MATIRLPPDFKEFLQLLNAHQVEYLLVGGYAVGYHGYPRATVDMDIWIGRSAERSEDGVCASGVRVRCPQPHAGLVSPGGTSYLEPRRSPTGGSLFPPPSD